MIHTPRITWLFLCFAFLLVCIFPMPVYTKDQTIIDISYVSKGYFTIDYSDSNPVKMKVGVTYNKAITYYDYDANETSSYALTQGNGIYTISLYRNISETKYKRVAVKKAKVVLENALSPYLVSTREIEFTKDDNVSLKAAEICECATNTYSKVISLCEFISTNISYDYVFAENIANGTITSYRPNASEILKNKKGICYDYAVLFAAMCRSQGIPCSIEKGYYKNVYHSWNRVYIDNVWYIVDFTIYYNNTFIT